MKRRAIFACALAAVAAMALCLAGCSQEEYTPKTLTPTVSSPTVQEDGVLKVGVSGGAPFVIESADSLGGLDVDVAAAIADELGLKLEIVDLGTDTASVEDAIAAGTVDMVMSATSADASDNVWVSDSYIDTGVVLFAASGTEAPVVGGETSPIIAAQSNSTSAWAAINAFGDEAVISANDLVSAFSSYESGDASFVAADAVIGSYVVLCQNLEVVPVALMGESSGYCIAVSSANTDLQNAVATALGTIKSNGIMDLIGSRRLGTVPDLSTLPAIATSTANTSNSASDEAADSEEVGSDSTAGANAVVQ